MLQHLARPAPRGAPGGADLFLSGSPQRLSGLQVRCGGRAHADGAEAPPLTAVSAQWRSRADRWRHRPGVRGGLDSLRDGPHLLQPQMPPHAAVQLQHLPRVHGQDHLLRTWGPHTHTHTFEPEQHVDSFGAVILSVCLQVCSNELKCVCHLGWTGDDCNSTSPRSHLVVGPTASVSGGGTNASSLRLSSFIHPSFSASGPVHCDFLS